MGMCVEQARQDGEAREIEKRGARGHGQTGADGADFPVFDQDNLVRGCRAAFGIDEKPSPNRGCR